MESIKKYLRVFAAIICVMFTTTEVTLAGSVYQIKVPEELGKVESRFKGKDDKTVVLVRDAHTSKDAQKNISKIVDYLTNNHDINQLNLEGASGSIDLDFYRRYPNKEVSNKIMAQMLDKHMITGAEHAAMASSKIMTVYGVEDKDAYDKNFQAYKDVEKDTEAVEKILEEIEKELDQLKDKIYDIELAKLNRIATDYTEGKTSFADYVKEVLNLSHATQFETDPTKYVYLSLFKELIQKEKFDAKNQNRIDFGKLIREVENLSFDLQKYLAKSEIEKNLIETSKVVHILKSLITLQALPQDVAYYRNHKNQFQPTAIDAALQKATDHLMQTQTPAEKTKNNLLNPRSLTSNLFRSVLKKSNTSRLEKLKVVKSILKNIEKFYLHADNRSQVLVENTLKNMDQGKTKNAMVISGGFHTEDMAKELRKKDISYVVVNPKIADIENKIAYDELMMKPVSAYEMVLERSFSTLQAPLGAPEAGTQLAYVNASMLSEKALQLDTSNKQFTLSLNALVAQISKAYKGMRQAEEAALQGRAPGARHHWSKIKNIELDRVVEQADGSLLFYFVPNNDRELTIEVSSNDLLEARVATPKQGVRSRKNLRLKGIKRLVAQAFQQYNEAARAEYEGLMPEPQAETTEAVAPVREYPTVQEVVLGVLTTIARALEFLLRPIYVPIAGFFMKIAEMGMAAGGSTNLRPQLAAGAAATILVATAPSQTLREPFPATNVRIQTQGEAAGQIHLGNLFHENDGATTQAIRNALHGTGVSLENLNNDLGEVNDNAKLMEFAYLDPNTRSFAIWIHNQSDSSVESIIMTYQDGQLEATERYVGVPNDKGRFVTGVQTAGGLLEVIFSDGTFEFRNPAELEVRPGKGSEPKSQATQPLEAPSGLSLPRTNTSGFFQFRWDAVVGADFYQVQYSPDPTFQNLVAEGFPFGTFEPIAIVDSDRVYFRVRTIGFDGSASEWSPIIHTDVQLGNTVVEGDNVVRTGSLPDFRESLKAINADPEEIIDDIIYYRANTGGLIRASISEMNTPDTWAIQFDGSANSAPNDPRTVVVIVQNGKVLTYQFYLYENTNETPVRAVSSHLGYTLIMRNSRRVFFNVNYGLPERSPDVPRPSIEEPKELSSLRAPIIRSESLTPFFDRFNENQSQRFQVRWTPVEGAQFYQIEYSPDRNFQFRVASGFPRGAFEPLSIDESDRVYFRVRAFDADGKPTAWSRLKSVVVNLAPPFPEGSKVVRTRDGLIRELQDTVGINPDTVLNIIEGRANAGNIRRAAITRMQPSDPQAELSNQFAIHVDALSNTEKAKSRSLTIIVKDGRVQTYRFYLHRNTNEIPVRARLSSNGSYTVIFRDSRRLDFDSPRAYKPLLPERSPDITQPERLLENIGVTGFRTSESLIGFLHNLNIENIDKTIASSNFPLVGRRRPSGKVISAILEHVFIPIDLKTNTFMVFTKALDEDGNRINAMDQFIGGSSVHSSTGAFEVTNVETDELGRTVVTLSDGVTTRKRAYFPSSFTGIGSGDVIPEVQIDPGMGELDSLPTGETINTLIYDPNSTTSITRESGEEAIGSQEIDQIVEALRNQGVEDNDLERVRETLYQEIEPGSLADGTFHNIRKISLAFVKDLQAGKFRIAVMTTGTRTITQGVPRTVFDSRIIYWSDVNVSPITAKFAQPITEIFFESFSSRRLTVVTDNPRIGTIAIDGDQRLRHEVGSAIPALDAPTVKTGLVKRAKAGAIISERFPSLEEVLANANIPMTEEAFLAALGLPTHRSNNTEFGKTFFSIEYRIARFNGKLIVASLGQTSDDGRRPRHEYDSRYDRLVIADIDELGVITPRHTIKLSITRDIEITKEGQVMVTTPSSLRNVYSLDGELVAVATGFTQNFESIRVVKDSVASREGRYVLHNVISEAIPRGTLSQEDDGSFFSLEDKHRIAISGALSRNPKFLRPGFQEAVSPFPGASFDDVEYFAVRVPTPREPSAFRGTTPFQRYVVSVSGTLKMIDGTVKDHSVIAVLEVQDPDDFEEAQRSVRIATFDRRINNEYLTAESVKELPGDPEEVVVRFNRGPNHIVSVFGSADRTVEVILNEDGNPIDYVNRGIAEILEDSGYNNTLPGRIDRAFETRSVKPLFAGLGTAIANLVQAAVAKVNKADLISISTTVAAAIVVGAVLSGIQSLLSAGAGEAVLQAGIGITSILAPFGLRPPQEGDDNIYRGIIHELGTLAPDTRIVPGTNGQLDLKINKGHDLGDRLQMIRDAIGPIADGHEAAGGALQNILYAPGQDQEKVMELMNRLDIGITGVITETPTAERGLDVILKEQLGIDPALYRTRKGRYNMAFISKRPERGAAVAYNDAGVSIVAYDKRLPLYKLIGLAIRAIINNENREVERVAPISLSEDAIRSLTQAHEGQETLRLTTGSA